MDYKEARAYIDGYTKSGGKVRDLSRAETLMAKLGDFLEKEVFGSCKKTTAAPENELVESFNIFFDRYMKGLAIEKAAVENV